MATTIYNQAQLNYNDTVIRSNTVTAELVDVLSVTKTPINQTYGSGDRVTYVIELTNTGTAPLTGLTVTDDLGAYSPAAVAPASVRPLTYVEGTAAYFVDGAFSVRPTVTATAPLTVTGLDLPAGSTATLVYEADVNEYAPLGAGGEINNTVSVTGAGLAEPALANAVITAADAPDLTIAKAVTPTVIPENGRVTYSFTVENSGNTAAENTVYISDTFNPVLSDVTVTLDGTPLTSPADYTYDTASGAFATVPGVITVPAATYTEDPATGATVVAPGSVTLTVSGTVA